MGTSLVKQIGLFGIPLIGLGVGWAAAEMTNRTVSADAQTNGKSLPAVSQQNVDKVRITKLFDWTRLADGIYRIELDDGTRCVMVKSAFGSKIPDIECEFAP